MVVVGSLFERRAAGVYHNTAVVLDADGALRGLYRKMHIPDDPLYYEKFYFTPGDLGFQRVRHRVRPRRHAGLLGPVVSRGGAADGAARAPRSSSTRPPSAGTRPRRRSTAPAQADAWQTDAARARDRQRRLRRGRQPRRPRGPGRRRASSSGAASFVADPFGRVLAEASRDGEEILIVDVRPAPHRRRRRRNWPFLRDRRIDAYGPITQRFLDASSRRH